MLLYSRTQYLNTKSILLENHILNTYQAQIVISNSNKKMYSNFADVPGPLQPLCIFSSRHSPIFFIFAVLIKILTKWQQQLSFMLH